MAAPTPPSASKRPTTSVSTPSGLNQSSPAPRSVPSPVTARYAAGKTPISSGTKTSGGTPMIQNLSQTGHTSSPSANMLGFTPSGLGIEGVPTPALGGTSMIPTMSDLGLTVSGAKRNEDEERRARMRKVLKTIGKAKGRVSEEGIARISRRLGFDNDIDALELTPEERERKVGNRTISIAGKSIVIDVDLKNHLAQSVQLAFSVQGNSSLDEQGEWAGRVLLDDLKTPEGIALNAKLDRFALNLERLAKVDRLGLDGVNCFEALSGVYASFKTLYEQEKKVAMDTFGTTTTNVEKRADVEVLCKKSGRPLVNSGGQLGLKLAYWRESRHIDTANEQMDVDMHTDEGRENTNGSTDYIDATTSSLKIEVESSPAGLYPSLRVSKAWLPDPLELPTVESGEGIPWQDPPQTFLSSASDPNAMAVDSGQKLPDRRFIARLDPPLLMPYLTALNVLTAVGATPPNMLTVPPQYAALLLDPSATTKTHTDVAGFKIRAEQDVLSLKGGVETTVKHSYVLDCAKPAYADYGYTLDQLPFSHPRQLVELLPTLRQWVCVGSLLKTAFKTTTSVGSEKPATNGVTNGHGSTDGDSCLDELLNDSDFVPPTNDLSVSITLVSAPHPTLNLSFPMASNSRIANVSVQVLPNADLVVTSHEGIVANNAANTAEEGQRLAEALDVCGDLGVWIEWMRNLAP